MGFSQLLKRTLSEPGGESLDIIYKSGEHLLTLIDDILDLSKIEAGKLSLCSNPVNLGGFLAEIDGMIGFHAVQRSIQWTLAPDGDLPNAIEADALRLRQVLLNLLNNAVKFTPEGRVTLRVAPVRQDGDRAVLWFTVEDTGGGIAPEELARIFKGPDWVRQRGFQAFLPKPVDLDRLLSALKTHLGLTWQIADDGPPSPTVGMVAPDKGIIEEIARMAESGYMFKVIETAETLKAGDPRYAPFAGRLIELAESFDAALVIRFLQGLEKKDCRGD